MVGFDDSRQAKSRGEPAAAESPRLAAATARAGWRWIAGLVLLPTGVFLELVLHERAWGWLGILHLRPYFTDIVAILASGEAWHSGIDPFAPNPFDPMHRPHVYGPWWLVTGWLGLRPYDALWLGPLLDGTFLLVAALVLAPRGAKEWIAAVALLVSPPMLLALERANNDLIVLLLLAAAAWLITRPRWAAGLSGAILISVAAVLKMYPAAALGGLAGCIRTRRGLVLVLVAVSAMAISVWLEANGFRRALAVTPRPYSIFAYGAAVSAVTWRTLVSARGWLLLGAALAVGVFGSNLIRNRRQLWTSVPLAAPRGFGFVMGALCWLGCYLIASNYSYRAVLLLLPAGLWLQQWKLREFARAARWQCAGWIIVLWLMVPKRWLAVAALAPSSAGALVPLSIVVGFEQTLVLLLTLALAVASTGWLVRNLRARGTT